MIDHLSVTLSDYPSAVPFYRAVLGALGYAQLFSSDSEALTATAYGKEAPVFWIASGQKAAGALHIAFKADSREAVDRFHAAALNGGGRDNGSPGYRTQYYSGYYAAYVLDVDGNNIEAVFHDTSLLGSNHPVTA